MRLVLAALLVTSLVSCLEVHVHVPPSPATAAPSVAGTWQVQGEDAIPWSARLVLEEGTGRGHFDWRSPRGDSGRELVTWRYDASTRTLHLEGHELLHPHGSIGVGTYAITLGDDGRRLVAGTWGAPAMPGTWEAVR